ncbi:TioE family transcriptional regulator [Streptomyces sp. CA-210063]|uniref:TioE family transcriptional regulator n=1 Tax=Streptomyces sp. CA-210063 TaxID=2801029 RepID=UPI00214C09D2|nr:TioE family transcriptional regulator [Streptomyces sp. CA-210063]UUU32889.1 TioE family transcriptional regulator [Streptomyces sp. CA-210063]
MRPSDLAREHGLSTQAVRNYERDGFIPAAERTDSGYRIYTEVHAAALRAFLALVPAYGHSAAGRIMRALHDDALDDALTLIDRGHGQLRRDRETLDAVREAVDHLMAESDGAGTPGRPVDLRSRSAGSDTLTVGELARRLSVTPATLRKWEDSGILAPERDPLTAYRVYRASDVRDAELAHLLRRGGYPLDRISTVVQQIRTAGGTDTLSGALDDWRRRLTARGLAMLDAATHLGHYLSHCPGVPTAQGPGPYR